jgi:intracellular septation protein A
MVSVASPDRPAGEHSTFSMRAVLLAVGRRSLPHLLEATLIPAFLFWAVMNYLGTGAAMITVLMWTFGAVARRLAQGQRIPGVLLLATIGLTVRTVVGLLSGSAFMYFVQPVATTVVLSGVFLVSALMGRPLIARLAGDFCPMDDAIGQSPAVAQLFSGLTLLWAGIHLLNAATTFGLLVSLPLGTFVAIKTGASLAITFAAILFTISWAMRVARSENLIFCPADN